MPRLVHTLPSYRKHKASGQAVVTIAGRDFYLGPWNSVTSRRQYDRIIGEWMARGRAGAASPTSGFTIAELMAAFLVHAQGHYRQPTGQTLPDGTAETAVTKELKCFVDAMRPLRKLYADTDVSAFGPLALRALREQMVGQGWSRRYINKQVNRVRAVFRFGEGRELVPAGVWAALRTVEPLAIGRTSAREMAPVKPVAPEHARAIYPHVSRQVGAMIELQLLTGMRPGEVCAIRGCDIDTCGELWIYRPARHKTLHHGHAREILLGPRAVELVKQFLKADMQAPIFSPADAERERREARTLARMTPLTTGNRPGTNRRRRPRRTPGDRYGVAEYGRAIRRACELAFPPPAPLARFPRETIAAWTARLTDAQHREMRAHHDAHRWHPHQLRHTAATELRRRFGVEAARVILGHRSVSITELYAEQNREAAAAVMKTVG